jgi:hypothetical protein
MCDYKIRSFPGSRTALDRYQSQVKLIPASWMGPTGLIVETVAPGDVRTLKELCRELPWVLSIPQRENCRVLVRCVLIITVNMLIMHIKG